MNTIARTIRPLCLLGLLSACGEPVYENAGSQHSLLEDQEACAAELEQSSEAIAYRQNPTAHPDYVSQVFAGMDHCLERKGWKQVSAQQGRGNQPSASEFTHAGYPVSRLDPTPAGLGARGVEEIPTRTPIGAN